MYIPAITSMNSEEFFSDDGQRQSIRATHHQHPLGSRSDDLMSSSKILPIHQLGICTSRTTKKFSPFESGPCHSFIRDKSYTMRFVTAAVASAVAVAGVAMETCSAFAPSIRLISPTTATLSSLRMADGVDGEEELIMNKYSR